MTRANALLLAFICCGFGVGSAFASGSHIGVVGVGELTIPAETAVVRVQVEGRHAEPVAAKNEAERVVKRLLEALAQLGIATQDIEVDALWIDDELRSEGDGHWERVGYLAERPVKIAIESMNQIDPVIRAALEAGATKIDSVGYGLADEARHMSKVRSLAFEDARDEAHAYAGLAGACLGSVQKISTGPSTGGGFQEIVVTAHKTSRSGEEEIYVPGIYSQGKVTLRERVEVVFDLETCQ